MPFSKESLQKSPYNKCIICEHLGIRCDGPNFLCMTVEEWCDWCKLRRDYLGVSNEWIAEQALVSDITVRRIMSRNVGDLKVSTMQLVTKALVNGSWGKYPCANQEPEVVYQDNPHLVRELEALHEERKRLISAADRRDQEHAAALQSAVDKAERDGQRKVDYLKRIIRILAIVAGIFGALIITALIVDRLNYDVGFFWRAAATGWADGGNTADAIRFLRG